MSKASKKRLDVLLVERGLAQSRAQAQALVMAGRVRGYAKAGAQVDETAELDLQPRDPYVSRGGPTLAAAPRAPATSSRTPSTSPPWPRRAPTRSTSAPPPAGSRTSSCSAAPAA